jgi:hypothetical protein
VLGFIPVFHASAFMVVVDETVIELVYIGDNSVGVVPSVV